MRDLRFTEEEEMFGGVVDSREIRDKKVMQVDHVEEVVVDTKIHLLKEIRVHLVEGIVDLMSTIGINAVQVTAVKKSLES